MRTVRKISITLILLVGVLFAIQSCHKDDVNSNSISDNQKFKIEKITFNDFSKKNDNFKALDFIRKRLQNNDDKDIIASDGVFTISTDNINMVETDYGSSYSFNVINRLDLNHSFENFIVTVYNDGHLEFRIIGFTSQDNNSSISSYNIESLIVDNNFIDIEQFFNTNKEYLYQWIGDCLYYWTSGASFGWTEDGILVGCDYGAGGNGDSSDTNSGDSSDETSDNNDFGSGLGNTGGGYSGGSGSNATDTQTSNSTLPKVPIAINLPYSEQINNIFIDYNQQLSSEQLNWLENNYIISKKIVSFLDENNTPEAVAFVMQAIFSEDSQLINDMFDWINENENSQESIIASTLTLTAINNNILESGYSPEVANILNQNANVDFIDPTYYAYFTIQCAILKLEHPEWSDIKIYWEASKEMIHIALDLAGLFPLVGEVFDVTNGIIYTIEGDGLNATLSYAGAIPFAGWYATGGKYAIKVINTSSTVSITLKWIKRADGLISFGDRAQLRKVLGLTDRLKQAHHLIPWEFCDNPIVQKAAQFDDGWHMNKAFNGIPLPTSGHLTGHAAYNAKISQKLDELNLISNTPQQAYDNLLNLVETIRTLILNNPNMNLGQIANLIP